MDDPSPTTVDDGPPPPRTSPPYDPPPIGPRRLTRSGSDRMIAGVCGGIADYLGVDATLVRIGWALLSLTGIGLVAYAVAWALLPQEGGAAAPRWRSPWQLAGIAVGVWILANWIDFWDGDALTFPFALLVIGAVLVWGARPSDDGAPGRTTNRLSTWASEPRAGGVAPEPTTVIEQTGPGRWSWAPPPSGPTGPAVPVAAPPRRDRSGATRAIAVGLGGILIAVGAISGAVALSLSPRVVLGLSLAGLGAVMVLGAWWGWARPLAFGGMLLILAIAAVAVIDVPITGGTGERIVRPASVGELPSLERLAAGDLTLDLTDVTFAGDERRIEATVAAGELTVLVPEGVTVELHGEVGAGVIDAFGTQDDGWSVEVDRTVEGAGAGRIELDLRVGVGHLEVERG